jgi:DNA-binding HxlR family transcriptional regulator
VTATYELTDLGLSLQDVMHGVKAWPRSMDDRVAERERPETTS